MSERPVLRHRRIPCAAPDDGASPAGDFLDGEVAARLFLSAVDRSEAGPDALTEAVRELLASRGREIPPSHYLNGFCQALQRRIQEGQS